MVVNARGAGCPRVVIAVVVVVVDPIPGGDGADAEPDETGGTVDHVIALEVVVPVHVVMWHEKRGSWGVSRGLCVVI